MANSKKWSQFTQQVSFTSADLMAIVRDGTNYTVPTSALPAFLGVTGTINVVGSGTPILEQPDATTNNIRSVEDGNGIISAISGTNGISIAHNFTQDVVATQLVSDLATASPTFPSFAPGDGMQISRAADVITFTATGALPATKVVAVNSMSDFPAAVGSVRTLEDDTVYVISNAMTTADRFVMGSNTTVTSYSVLGPLLTYSGSGTMFTSIDVGCVFLNLHLTAPSGKVFDLSDTTPGTNITAISSVNIDTCVDIGDLTSLFSCAIDNLVCISVTGRGLLFAGTGWQLISVVDTAFVTANATFISVDLGTVVAENIDIGNMFVSYVSGAIGVKGAASNANLTATGKGSVIDTDLVGAGTALSGLTSDDLRWNFQGNQQMADTRPDSLSVNTAGTTVTIATQSVPVKIAGTWIDDNSSQFTVDLAGRVTYNGVKDLHIPIDISVTADPVSGSNKDFAVCVAINGTAIANSCVPARASSTDLISVSVPWQYVFQTGDYVEAWIQNDTDTTNFNITHAIIRVN